MTSRHRVVLVAVAMLAVAGCGSDKPDAEKESPAAKPSASQETSDEERKRVAQQLKREQELQKRAASKR